MNVLVVGSIALDTVRAGKTVKKDILGGSCTYFAVAASFAAHVQVVGAVGKDFPQNYVKLLKKFDIDLAGLQIVPDEPTFRWAGTYSADMNERTTDKLEFGALAKFDPILPSEYLGTRHVFLANAQPELQLKVLSQLRKSPITVCDTIDHYIKNDNKKVREVLSKVDGTILNDGEARLLTGEDSNVAAARALLKMGPKFAVVKKGEHGCLLAVGDNVFAYPAWPLDKVVDPTGAGDAFAGGFMGCLASLGKPTIKTLRECIAFGTSTASYTCCGFSLDCLAETPSAEVRKRVRDYREMLQIG